MCGICGFVGKGHPLTRDDLLRMNETIVRRGPDDDGHYWTSEVGLAMRRLSILDLGGGHQPISNEDGSITVVFNGEIYNYRQLRQALLARGHTFKTKSDTEVLVHAYEEYGKDFVHHLRGMFAFAIWDQNAEKLLLARDRLGIKPLYYVLHEGTLLFGSEIKAITAAGLVPMDIDWQAVDAYLTFTYIPAPYTIYKHIAKLPPGCLLIHQDGRQSLEPYWDVDFSRQDHQMAAEEWRIRVEKKLYDAVESHLVSDVPLGAFLSGGIDSSLVVAMMSKITDSPVETFTMGFAGQNISIRDERPYARLLGTRYGVAHNEFTVEPDFRGILDEVLEAFDEPFADDSIIPTYYICESTRRKVKVALSGLGGDELFGGYHRYRGLLLSQYYGKLPRGIHSRVVDPIIRSLPEPKGGNDRIDHLKRFSGASSLPPDLRYLEYVSSADVEQRKHLYSPDLLRIVDFDATSAVVTEPFNRCETDSLLDRALYVDFKTYLPDDILALSDRLSMWHSLEVRVPLVDHELVELAARVPATYKVRPGGLKWLLKSVAVPWLPKQIITHRKQGFESPMASWLRHDLRLYAKEALLDGGAAELELFDRAQIERLLDDHWSGKRKNNKILLSLLILFQWLRNHNGA